MKKNLVTVVIVVATMILGWRMYIYIQYSESRIRSRVLTATPVGTAYEMVEAHIREQGWNITSSSLDHGFLDQRLSPPRPVGVMYLRAHVGFYFDLLRKDITVFWGFDESGSLIDIWVWTTTDSL
jgi:hypothetical protein